MNVATQTEADGAVIDRLFDALAHGDVAAAQACCTPDAVIWHNFDRQPMSLDAVAQSWRELVAGTAERTVVDVRRHAVPGGFAQQHLMVIRPHEGPRRGWPIAIFVQVQGGRIARLEEYIDRGGSYPIADDEPLTTPGLALRA